MYYSTGGFTTQRVAGLVAEGLRDLGAGNPEPIRSAVPDDLAKHEYLVVGAPSYLWDKFQVSALDWDTVTPPHTTPRDLEGKKVAVFGTGNQVDYPDNFADAVGIVAEMLEERGATIVGATDVSGYTFSRSRAVQLGRFRGLVIDDDTQPELTQARVDAWVSQLKTELN